MKKTKYYYNWKQFDDDCNFIAKQIKKQPYKLKCVYGPPRGGCILAVKLSHLLGLKYLTSLDEEHIPFNTLIVDDISDTGKTLLKIIKKGNSYKTYTTATLFIKTKTKYLPHIFCRSQQENIWIVYPWEV